MSERSMLPRASAEGVCFHPEPSQARNGSRCNPLCFGLITPPALVDCTTVLVGSKATIDGSLLVGHNEDNDGRIVMPQYYVPRMKHETGEVIRFENGGTTPQVPGTWAFLWSSTMPSSAAGTTRRAANPSISLRPTPLPPRARLWNVATTPASGSGRSCSLVKRPRVPSLSLSNPLRKSASVT
ncbi:MAG TPA: hypothetical protein DDW96_04790 [Synergistaceae bacterium]|nr:hypothetical protein [Synergistaceae bacterium]